MTSERAQEVNSMMQKRCIASANKLINLCNLPHLSISSFKDLNSNFFVELFEGITGHSIPDLLPSNDIFSDEHNVQAVIDTLSLDLLGLSLYHISGENVVSGDPIAISNLLEVLEAIFLHLIEQDAESKDSTDVGSSPKFRYSISENGHKKSSSDDLVYAKYVPPGKKLKRKTCTNTLRKSHRFSAYEKKLPSSSSDSNIQEYERLHSKIQSDGHVSPITIKTRNVKQAKKENVEPIERYYKHHPDQDIEKLYDINFEKKIRAVLLSNKSPRLRSLQLKRNYMQNLKSPLKRPTIPVCKKSYLLPYNLRRKSVQPPKAKIRKVQREGSIKKTPEKAGRKEAENSMPLLIESLLEEFPGFHFPKNTLSLLTKHYSHHLGYLHKQMRNVYYKKPAVFKEAAEASEEQSKLSKIMTKDLKEKKYLHEVKEQQASENRIKYGLRDARFRSVKMKQYIKEFHTSMQRKMQKRNYSEELIIEKTFKEVLNLQKENVRNLCQKVKEADKQDVKQYRKYLAALQHLYNEQLDLLTESLVTKQKNSSERRRDQDLAVKKMDQEFYDKLRNDIRSLQNDVLEIIKDIHFRELDAENYIQQQRLKD